MLFQSPSKPFLSLLAGAPQAARLPALYSGYNKLPVVCKSDLRYGSVLLCALSQRHMLGVEPRSLRHVLLKHPNDTTTLSGEIRHQAGCLKVLYDSDVSQVQLHRSVTFLRILLIGLGTSPTLKATILQECFARCVKKRRGGIAPPACGAEQVVLKEDIR